MTFERFETLKVQDFERMERRIAELEVEVDDAWRTANNLNVKLGDAEARAARLATALWNLLILDCSFDDDCNDPEHQDARAALAASPASSTITAIARIIL